MPANIPWQQRLFPRTFVLLLLVFLIFQGAFTAIGAYFIGYPLIQRSSDDLAALLIQSSRVWIALSGAQREAYSEQLWQHQTLRITPAPPHTARAHQATLPYMQQLTRALQRHGAEQINLQLERQEKPFYWITMSLDHNTVHVGFARERIGTRPLTTLVSATLVGILLSLAFSLALANWLSLPLRRLAGAAVKVGVADGPQHIEQTGPAELRELAQGFNRMSARVHELLANRTTLLAGISHDLRTPLTRMKLALEMLESSSDPELIQHLQGDLDAMDALIEQFLSLARGIQTSGERCRIDLKKCLQDWIEDARRSASVITFNPPSQPIPYLLVPDALRRVITNLLENAQRYAGEHPIEVFLKEDSQWIQIGIEDRGPGIPEEALDAVFEPFYRLENSRNTASGGSGLGLAITQQISQNQGWSVRLQHREGGGTTALVLLPQQGTALETNA